MGSRAPADEVLVNILRRANITPKEEDYLREKLNIPSNNFGYIFRRCVEEARSQPHHS